MPLNPDIKCKRRLARASALVAIGCLLPLGLAADDEKPSDGTTARTAAVRPAHLGIRFEGLLPGSIDPNLEGEFQLTFRIYRSPQGGTPIWEEAQKVKVRKGRMDVGIGKVRTIPMEIHEATFKFLGVSVNRQKEVYPRFPIVNVVYVSEREALAAGGGRPKEERYTKRGLVVGDRRQAPLTWAEALKQSRAAGGDLPDYEDWYRSMETAEPKAARERAGHYEWVLPWVYDTASHGRYNRYFRGRFQGCDYMDLSPKKRYPYRISFPAPESAAGDSKEPPSRSTHEPLKGES